MAQTIAPPGAVAHAIPSRAVPLFVVVFLFWASMYFYVPILPVYASSLGASSVTVGLLVGAYGFSQMVLRIPIGIASDRLGRRRVFVAGGCLAATIGAIGLAIAPEPAWLVVARGVVGISAATFVALSILFSAYFPPGEATRAMSLLAFVGAASQLFATSLGGWTADAFGWHAPMLVAAVLGVVGLVGTFALPEPAHRPNRTLTLAAIRRVASVPLLLAVSVASAFAQYAFWGTTYSFVPVYAAALGATRTELGLLTTVGVVPAMFSALLVAPLNRRLGERWTVIVGLTLSALGAAVVPLMPSLLPLAVSQFVAGVGRGISQPLLMGLSIQTVVPEERATAMGFYQAIYAIGMFLGPVTAGIVAAQVGLAGAFVVCAALCTFGAAIVGRVVRKP